MSAANTGILNSSGFLNTCIMFCCSCCCCFETAFHFVAITTLDLTTQNKQASNSERSNCLCLSSAGINDMHHHSPTLFSQNYKQLLTFLFAQRFVFMCIHVLPACKSVPCPYSASGHQKRTLAHLRLTLQMVVRCHLGTENQTPVLCKISQRSKPLSHLSSPQLM